MQSRENKLTGSAQENKRVFDTLIEEVVKTKFNALIDELTALTAAAQIGADVQGLISTNVNAALAELLAEMKPDRAIFVGDRIGDFNAAHACHVPALAAKFGYGNPAEWAQAEAVCETVEGLSAAARALLETPAARMGGRG